MRAVYRDGKPRRTGQCTGDQPDQARRVDPHHIFQYQACEAGGADNQQGEYNQRFPF